jgi:hypothetical protein
MCSGANIFDPKNYSLTCDARAPFLTYEVGSKVWEELRNPGLFSQFLGVGNPTYHYLEDERVGVPGKKAFMRMNGTVNGPISYLNMPNIAFQSWKSMSFAIRFQTMPVMETLCHLFPGGSNNESFAIIAKPDNGSTANISIEHNWNGGRENIPTSYHLNLGTWYLFYVNNNKISFDVYCNSIDGFIANGGAAAAQPMSTIPPRGPLWNTNATWNPAPGQPAQPCNILFGGGLFQGSWGGIYGTSSFQYDLAWVHFFDKTLTKEDVVRECKANWVYTQFPSAYNKYVTTSA